LTLVSDASSRYPTAFGRWLSAAESALNNGEQVAVLGESQDKTFSEMMQIIRSKYRPAVVLVASAYPPSPDSPALLMDRPLIQGKPTAYVCEGFVRKLPTTDPDALKV
jgi:uncharacterized protein YyaL (SSP411 family)